MFTLLDKWTGREMVDDGRAGADETIHKTVVPTSGKEYSRVTTEFVFLPSLPFTYWCLLLLFSSHQQKKKNKNNCALNSDPGDRVVRNTREEIAQRAGM